MNYCPFWVNKAEVLRFLQTLAASRNVAGRARPRSRNSDGDRHNTVNDWPPIRPVAGHLAVLGLVGVIVVEFCLHGFHKFPFACSYLPGQPKVHVILWGLLLVLVPLSVARVERGMLNRPLSYFCMVALLATIAVTARWRTTASAKSTEGLVFEEEHPPELLALGLDGH